MVLHFPSLQMRDLRLCKMKNIPDRGLGGMMHRIDHPCQFIIDKVHFVLLANQQQLLLTCRDCQGGFSVWNFLRLYAIGSPFIFLEVLEILLEVPRLPTIEACGPPLQL